MFSFIFPGQGSQSPGMGRFLFDQFPVAKQTFEEANDSLGFNLQKLCFEGREEDLALTANTQPAIVTTSIATARVLQAEFGLTPLAVAGHSVGEYSALVSAQVIPFSQAVQAVRLRGQAMQDAVPVGQGGMAAIMGLEPAQVEKLCQHVETESGLRPLSVANYNCPGQIVISGNLQALQWMKDSLKIEELFGSVRFKMIPLQVSAPFHCSMMLKAEETMREFLGRAEFADASVPVVQNLTARGHTSSSEIKENLIRQISGPVQWMQSMNEFLLNGWTTSIECGNGKVLNGLLKKIDSSQFKVFNVNSIEDLKLIGDFLGSSQG